MSDDESAWENKQAVLVFDMRIIMLCSRIGYHLSGGSHLLYCSFTKLRTTQAHLVSNCMKHLALHTKRFLYFSFLLTTYFFFVKHHCN